MSQKNKILLVSKCIYPLTGGSVIITEKLAEQFKKDELVVLGAKRLFGRKINRPANGPRFYTQLGEVNFKGRGDRFFVPLRYLLFPFLLWKIYRVLKKEKCTEMIAIFPDIFFCYASYLVAKWTKIPYYTYFHNTYLENRPSGHRHFFAKRWQPKIFSYSKKIFVMSDGMVDFYKKKYGYEEKFIPIVHTFAKYPEYQQEVPAYTDEKIKLVLIGNFNSSNLEASIRFFNAVNTDNRFEIHVYTSVPLILLKSRGVDVSNIKHHGYVDDSVLIDEIRKYHIAIITHGFKGGYSEVEYQTIFPTRTIPFLLSGLPLMVHSPKNCFLSDFITSKGCGDLVDEASETKILESLNRIVDDEQFRVSLLDKAKETVDMFYGPGVKEKLVKDLNE